MSPLFCFLTCVTLTYAAMPEPTKYVLSFPKIANAMNVTVNTVDYSKNYFLLLGDWGADDGSSGHIKIQKAVANLMKSFYASQQEKGMNLLFVGTVGDNFYCCGQNCSYWTKRWTNMYGDLVNYPWLSVYGNHDWGINDPGAMCAWGVNTPHYINPDTNIPYDANQLNSVPTKGCNPRKYYLPDFGYWYSIPDLDFEWIAMEETATICPNDMGNSNYKHCKPNDNSETGCGYLGKIQKATEELMKKRANHSSMHNFILSQHYPSKGADLVDEFKDIRKNSPHKKSGEIIWSVYGHTHVQQCDRKDNNGLCDCILTGGGGGCCSTDTLRGFYVVGFDNDKKMTQPYHFDNPAISCMYPCGTKLTNEDIIKDEFFNCCHTKEGKLCELFDMNKC